MYKTIEVGSPAGSYWERRVYAGPDTPLFLRLEGIYLDNPYSGSKQYISNPRLSSRWYASNGASIIVPDSARDVTPFCRVISNKGTPPSGASMLSELSQKWRNTDLNLGLVLSPEGRESVEMMGIAIQRIGKAAATLRKGNVTGFINALGGIDKSSRKRVNRSFSQGDLSGAFLAAHLGWEPLVKDVYAASNVDPPKIRGDRIESKQGSKHRSVTASQLYPGMSFSGKSFRVETLVADVEKAPAWSQRFGLDNPFLVAWNLVPLSFIADYFLPIGDTIDALAFVGSRGAVRGWKKVYDYELVSFTFAPGTLWYSSGGVDYTHRDSVTRTSMTATYSRQPWSPSLGEALSWNVSVPTSLTRLATMAALTHQSILSLGRGR